MDRIQPGDWSRPRHVDGASIAAIAQAAGASDVLGQLRDGGRVLSAHRRVLNLESAAGRLLVLHAPNVPPTPFSLILENIPDAPWPTAGTRARLGGTVLSAGTLQVSLANCAVAREAERVEPIGDVTAAHLFLEPWAKNSTFGAWWVHASEPADGFSAQVAARGQRAILELAEAASSNDARYDAMLRASGGLLGLGPGGTPSGDDFLLGFLAAWSRLDPEPEAASALAALLAEEAPARTTRLAAEFYWHLAADRLGWLLGRLLHAVAVRVRTTVEEAATLLASYGATSGRDTISGVHAYLLVRGAPRGR
jgi:hypothetical protein